MIEAKFILGRKHMESGFKFRYKGLFCIVNRKIDDELVVDTFYDGKRSISYNGTMIFTREYWLKERSKMKAL